MDFGRVITAMVTPMSKDFSVDYTGAQKLAAHLLATGSDAVVVSGTTGESPTTSKEEKLKLYAAVAEVTKGEKKPLIAGVGSNDTAATLELAKKAESLGADALLLVVPPYNKPPQEGLYRHFSLVAQAVSLPVILYNVPSRTVTSLEVDTVARLAEIDNIVAIKDATGDMERMTALKAATPADFLIYSGDDSVTLPMVALGGDGVISVASHLIGAQIQEMVLAAEQGDMDRGRELHYRYFHVFKKLFICANPIPLKYCLTKLGLPAGPCRLPLVPPTREQKRILDACLREAGLL